MHKYIWDWERDKKKLTEGVIKVLLVVGPEIYQNAKIPKDI